MRNRFVLRKDGEGPRRYQNLTALFIGEAITFDDIRAMPDCQATLSLLRKIAATGENSPRYSEEN